VKTISLKKVSAVAVASLGFGLLSVVPANAAATAFVLSAQNTTLSVAVGTAIDTEIRLSATGTPSATAVITDTLTIASKPGNSALAINSSATHAANKVTLTTKASGDAKYVNAVGSTAGTDVKTTVQSSPTALGANTPVATLAVTPDVPGVYVFTVTPAASVADTGQTETAVSVTVYAGYSVDGAKPNTSFMTQGVAIASSNQATTGGLGTVRVTNFEDNSADTRYYATVSGGTLAAVTVSNDIDKDASNTAGFNFTNGTNLAGGVDFYTDSSADVSDYVDFTVTSATAGNVTISVVKYDAATGIATKISTPVVVFTSALSLDPTVSTSKIYVGTAQNTEATAASTAPTTVAKAAGTDAAGFTVIVNDGYGNPVNAADVVVTIAGPGLICGASAANGSCTPAARVVATTSTSAGKAYINLDADGTAGVATLTFTAGTAVLGTKTVTFYGSAAKYTATTVLNALSDGSTTRDAVVVCATDAAGIAVPSSTIYAFSGDATVASVETSDSTVSAAVTEDKDGSAGTAIAPASYVAAKAIGCAGFSVTGLAQATKSSVTLTFGNASTLALSDVTTTAVVKVGAAQAASIALSTDKATYAPGEKMTITLTYTDAYGRSVGAGPGTGTLAAALTSSASLTGDALFATANNSKLGVTSITAYAPLTQGTVLLSGLTGTNATYLATAIRGIALSASVKVVDANQSSLLTQIDALNAKIVALNALIAKIMKKLGVK
jgi:hypothetical protein